MANEERYVDEERTTVTIRRAPKFSVFIVVGALIGFLVTLILTALYPADPEIGFAASLGYFLLYGVPLGAVIGAVVALIFDRGAHRRSTEAIAGKLAVHVEEPSPVSETAPDIASEKTSDSIPDSDG